MKTKQEHRTCVECGQKIPVERLRTLPETWTCVRCSSESAKTTRDVEVDGADFGDVLGSSQSNL